MKYLISIIMMLCLCGNVWAAAFTTKAAGNWSASGQTTWTQTGVPGNGDTVTISHAVAVDTNTTVGASGVEGVAAVTLAAGSLTVNAGVKLTSRGDLIQDNYPLIMQAGSTLEFDSSAAVAPATTSYKWSQGHTNTSPALSSFTANGTAGSHVTVTSNTGGANAYHASIAYPGSGTWTVAFTDFSRFGGNGHANAFYLRMDSTKHLYVSDSTFSNLGANIITGIGENNPAADWVFNRVSFTDFAVAPYIDFFLYAPTTGRREFTNCFVGGPMRWQSTGSLKGWTLDGSIFSGINVVSGPVGDIASAANVSFMDNIGSVSAYFFDLQGGIFNNLYFLNHSFQPNTQHLGGSIQLRNTSVASGLVEGSTNAPNALDFVALSVAQDTVTHNYIKNTVFALGADGRSPVLIAQLKGTKNTRFTFENNTAPVDYDNVSAPAVYTSSGSDSRGWAGQIESFKNNLFWTPNTPLAGSSAALTNITGTANKTGTALGTSTTTVLDTAGTFLTGVGSMEGAYWVKITSGPDIGLKRQVVSNTATAMTVSPAFPNTMASQTYSLFSIDQITYADYNASFNMLAEGTLYDSNNVSAVTGKRLYAGYSQTDPTAIGAHDVTLAALTFVDANRGLYNFATKSLGNATATTWATATAYTADQAVSRAVSGFYSNQVLNYRAIVPHTSSAATSPGGFVNTELSISGISAASPQVITTSVAHGLTSGARVRIRNTDVASANGLWTITYIDATHFSLNGSYLGAGQGYAGGYVDHNWRNYWEFEGMYELRRAQLQQTGYNANATQAKLLSWVKAGYAPTVAALKTSGYGGTYIGAVDPVIPVVGGKQNSSFNLGFDFGF